MSHRPMGRRPGDPADTRRDILDAARRQFAARGYERSTIRSIAADADVDPALVIHHFRTKQQLFVAAHELPANPAEILEQVGLLPADQRGAAIARGFLAVFAGPGSPALSLLRAAATNDDAAAMIREFVDETLHDHGIGLVAGPDAELRVALISSHMIGIVFNRELLALPALAERSLDDIIAAVAPALQHHLDGG